MIKPTHIAENKKTGEKVPVEFDEAHDQYKINWMVCLKDVANDWIINDISGVWDGE